MSLASNSKTNYQLGVDAETACKKHLAENGYEVIAERYKTKSGEIDIIVKNKTCLAFVEVKRRKYGFADDPVTPTQKKRIINAAMQYLAENSAFTNFDMRFDCIFVDKELNLNHITDSWRIEEI